MNNLREKAEFAWGELILLRPKNSTALWRHGKLQYDIKYLAKVKWTHQILCYKQN
jgi:hypothetical protein